jgi:hypothetical protein
MKSGILYIRVSTISELGNRLNYYNAKNLSRYLENGGQVKADQFSYGYKKRKHTWRRVSLSGSR